MSLSCEDPRCKWEIKHFAAVANNTNEYLEINLIAMLKGNGGENIISEDIYEINSNTSENILVNTEALHEDCGLKHEPFEYQNAVIFEDVLYDNYKICHMIDDDRNSEYQINGIDSDCSEGFLEVPKGCFKESHCPTS